MKTDQITSQNVQWFQEREVISRSGITMPLLLVPVPNGSAESYYVPLHSFLTFDQMGRPEGKFSFFLSKNPFPEKSYYRPYLEKAWLRLYLKHDLPGFVKDSLMKSDGAIPLFIRKATFSLLNSKTGIVLASKEKNGISPNFQLEVVLGPEDSDEFVHAVDGRKSALLLETSMEFSLPYEPETKKTIKSCYPLRQILMADASSQDLNWKSFFECNYFDIETGSYQQLPGIKKHLPARAAVPNKPVMLTSGKIAMSLNQALKPTNGIPAHVILNSHLSSHASNNLIKIDGLKIQPLNGTNPEHLPIVENEGQDFWKDRVDEKLYWCVPEFSLLAPTGHELPESSPYNFLFKNIGMDPQGMPVLEGEIKLTLAKSIPKKTKTAIDRIGNGFTVKLLEMEGMSVHLEIPFRNIEGTQMTTMVLAHELQEKGNQITCNFRLTNQWTRVCYGAASVTAYQQDSPLRIWASYTFKGYVPVKQQAFNWLANYKISALPLIQTRNSKEKTYFNNKVKKLILEGGEEISFFDSPVNNAQERSRNQTMVMANSVLKPSLSHHSITALNPALNKLEVNKIQKTEKFGVQSFGKKESCDVLFPCEDFGNYYRERIDNGFQPIGCKEPYRLGQIDFKLYKSIPELNHALYKVFRSTQSPNTFLVVPTAYKITRFESNKVEQAFQACIRLYSTIDIENLHLSNCVFDASLEPDIPPIVQKELNLALRSYTPYEPIIEFISEIKSEDEYALPDLGSIIENLDCFSLGRVIRLSISARIGGVLTLQSLLKNGSFNGKAVFRLPDGTEHESLLEPSLSAVCGSWSTGPFEIAREDGSISFTNRIEGPVNLLEIKLFDDHILSKTVPINQQLQSGETIKIGESNQSLNALPVYSVAQETVEMIEIRNYMEDIQSQLIFLTTVDFNRLQIEEIKVETRLHLSENSETVVLSEEHQSQEVILLIPLTIFVSERLVEFRTTLKKVGQEYGNPTEWQPWSLSVNGNIINITSSHLSTS